MNGTENSKKKYPFEIIELAHGAGGKLQGELIKFITKSLTKKKVSNGIGVDDFDDGATIPAEINNGDKDLVITADGHTISPLFFPGGDLGKLSITGTVNDIIMMGGYPIALTSIVLIEEGMSLDIVDKVMDSFNRTAKEANIAVIAGDTKVMPRGSLHEMVISTTGIGIRPKNRKIEDSQCKPGAKIILTGSIGDHGAALLAKREGINMETKLKSDVALLTPLLKFIEKFDGIFAMKDPTRGGISGALNDWAEKANVSIYIDEEELIIHPEVKGICDLLGLDPLEIANEGKALICIKNEQSKDALNYLKNELDYREARIIGQVQEDHPGLVIINTSLGGKRILEMPLGEPIPRIC